MKVRGASDSRPAGEDVNEQAEIDPSGEAFGEHGGGRICAFTFLLLFFVLLTTNTADLGNGPVESSALGGRVGHAARSRPEENQVNHLERAAGRALLSALRRREGSPTSRRLVLGRGASSRALRVSGTPELGFRPRPWQPLAVSPPLPVASWSQRRADPGRCSSVCKGPGANSLAFPSNSP